jgi:hypothetical protein
MIKTGMNKTAQKLGQPLLVIKGVTFKEELRIYSSNRESRDPVYRQHAINAANNRARSRWSAQKKARNGASFGKQASAGRGTGRSTNIRQAA